MKMLHQIPVVKEWQNPNDENTMYSDSQVKALWDQSTYALCPLFLDYPMDACPKNEKLIFAKASELRKARIAKEVLFYYLSKYESATHACSWLALLHDYISVGCSLL